jgi:hypothetical protein
LHAYLTLPSALFIDRYQLSDAAALAEHNLIALHALSGEDDLEAPDWVIKRWGSAALVELASPPKHDQGAPTAGNHRDWIATIPLHLRYLQASPKATHSGYADIDIPHPIVFWACEAEEGLKMAVNPFDRVNLGYDGLFGPKTMFYHVPPARPGDLRMLEERLTVPVLEPRLWLWVQFGILVAVLTGFLLVALGLLRSVSDEWSSRSAEKKKQ